MTGAGADTTDKLCDCCCGATFTTFGNVYWYWARGWVPTVGGGVMTCCPMRPLVRGVDLLPERQTQIFNDYILFLALLYWVLMHHQKPLKIPLAACLHVFALLHCSVTVKKFQHSTIILRLMVSRQNGNLIIFYHCKRGMFMFTLLKNTCSH